MHELGLDVRPGTVLCVGAHADDIELGCGGTLLRLLEWAPDTDIRWVVLTATEARRAEAVESARSFLGPDGGERVVIEGFRDGFLPDDRARLKERFEGLKSELEPDLIFTHNGRDLHQDHRTVSELTWQTFRNHLILEYEVPKYDGDFGAPNVFVPLEPEHVERKIEILLSAFASQRDRGWFDEETFRGVLRLRGVECQARYAEAFYARKLRLNLTP